MRYEDASQAGSIASGSDPIARADVESLPQGSNGPGSGNAISGLGTTTGASGADQVADGPATIVELRGAGGLAAPAADGFEAAGQYGTLSMDSTGNFNYIRTSAADGVQDVFQYTLADAKGARSSTTLTVEIPRVIDEQAVVNLPAGVQMSDIKVVGRDLVIQMPDGTQMVIPGGAVFVPELSIGDVIVPPTNLAALLIDSEPQPAAGPPQSSGGNFADDVPPLDPGVPLGDLIPPTELDYTPPEYEEPMEIEDTEPTIIIITPDNPAGAVNATASVDESGLPERPGEPEGTLEPQNIETTSGTIVFTTDDGLDTIAINGTVITAVGQQVQGEHGVLTITSINLATGEIGYSYTATDNTTDGVDDFEDFTVVVTDEDGDAATGTLHIDILDDEPLAEDDVDQVDLQSNTATGNVMTGVGTTTGLPGADTVGADNASLTAVEGEGGSDSSFNAEGNLVVDGEFGTLTIDAEGNYTYVPFADAPGGTEDVFTYTLTDGDGDVITATLTIINPDQTPTAGTNPIVQIDDDALAGGNPGGPNDDPDSVNATGTLSGSGGDGDLTFDLLTTGAPAGFTYVDGPNGSILVQQVQGGVTVTVLTITVDAETGQYTVVQNANILHPDGQTENNVVFTINYTVTDADGDVANSSLTVNVDDDTPLAFDDTETMTENETQETGNVITGAGTNEGTGNADRPGADGFAGIVALEGANGSDSNPSGGFEVEGEFGTLVMDADGNYTYTRDPDVLEGGEDVFTYTYVDGDGDTVTATLTITVPDIDLIPVATPPADVIVDDDDVGSDGNPDGVDDDDPQNTTGTLTGTGGNGDLDFFFDVTATENGLPTGFSLDPTSTSTSLLIMQGTTLVMTVTLNSETGEYTVVQNAPINHPEGDDENNVDFDIIFFAQDADGDQSDPETLNISVDDDTPEVSDADPVTGLVDEDDLPDGNDDTADGDDDPGNADGDNDGTTTGGAAGSLSSLFSIGADQPGKIVLLSDTSSLEAQNLTSGGEALSYDVDPVTGVLTGYVDADSSGTLNAGDATIFTLTVEEDGSWVFDLEGQLDHDEDATEDNIDIDFSGMITAEDEDGDPAEALPEGAFVVTVDDDLPVPAEEPDPVTGLVDEDDLPDGNDDTADGDDDPGNADGDNDGTTTGGAAGSLSSLFSIGADQPGKIVLLSDTSSLEAQNLTSGGEALSYDVDPVTGVLTGYVDADSSGTLNAGDATIFTLTVEEDGSWVFDLEGQLDHDEDATEDNIDIDFSGMITAEDEDGDPAEALPEGAFVVTVDDDLPVPAEEPDPVTGLVDEDDLPDGNDDTADGDDDPGNADGDNDGTTTGGAAGSLSSLFSIGADQPGKIVLLSDTSSLEAQNLTSGGEALSYDVDPVTGVLTGYVDADSSGTLNAGDATIFTLTVEEDGSWVFDLEGQLDHDEDATEDNIDIDFSGMITAEDEDGDPAEALPEGAFVVTVDDDLPVPAEEPDPVTGLVDEDDLPDGNDDTADGDDDPGNADGDNDGTTTGGAAGSLSSLFSIGADQPGKIVLLSDTSSLEAQNLTSGGEALSYDVDPVTGVLTGYVDADSSGTLNAGDATIFTLTVEEDGSWVFDLEGQLDHDEDATEDNIDIDFSGMITAEDEDGDPAEALPEGAFVVTVDDDLPVPAEEPDPVTGLVDEDDLPDGNDDTADGDDDPGNADGDNDGTTTGGAAGSLSSLFSIGADQPGKIVLLSDTSSLEAQNLTSGGEALSYDVDPVTGVLTGYVDADSSGTLNAGDATIFTLTVEEDGSWVFDLEGQLDHDEDATEDNIDIDFSGMITAEDEDGDPAEALPEGAFVVTVDDDLPVPAEEPDPVTGLVDEDDLPDGNDDTADGDDDPGNADGDNDGTTTGGAAGSLSSLFSIGADQPGKIVLLSDTSSLEAQNLTSGGEALSYDVDPVTGVLTGYVDADSSGTLNAGDATIFTLTVEEDGSWVFDLEGQLDHDEDATEDNIDIDFSGMITAEDEDGDPAEALPEGAFVVTVDDDLPTDFTPDEAVAENTGDNVVTGKLDLDDTLGNNIGADRPGSLAFAIPDNPDGTPLLNTDGQQITVNGVDVVLILEDDGSITATTDPDDPNATVFVATLDLATSSYEITFYQQLDNGSTSASDFTGAAAGNQDWLGIDPDLVNGAALDIEDANDPNDDSVDLLITALDHSTRAPLTVNRDADDIGAGTGQANDPDETLRIDFVQDLTRDAGQDEQDPGGYNFDTHVGQVVFSFMMVDTTASGDTAVLIEAFNVDDEAASKDDVTDATNNTPVEIDLATVVVTLNGVELVEGVDYFIYDSGNGVYLEGVPEGAVISFQAVGGVTFEAVEITNAAGHDIPGTDPAEQFEGADFAVGGFSYGINDPGDPVEFELPVELTDADGDTSEGTIDVTVYPEGQVPTLTATTLMMTEESTSQSADMSATVVPSNDNGAPVREFVAGNQAALIGAVAAAGLEMSGRIADVRAIVDDIRGDTMHASDANQAAISADASQGVADIAAAASADAGAKAAAELSAQSGGAPAKESPAGLDSANDDQSAELSALVQGTDSHSSASDHAAMTAAAVTMPGAELVAALEEAASHSVTAPEAASVAHTAEVGRVLADALAGGNGPDLEALVDALGGSHGGAGEALQALAGLRATDALSNLGNLANLGNGHTALSMDALALHHDATPV